ncbi:DUF3857 domain-containing transglutaminase family protein [Zhouia sp. PK063]|uniref:DUF3857 domain-containing transglutaminase family protein n=1 Tax=Zhouia sp. PK063 TaxID=3373602 RepID=UPI0037BA9674
MRKTTWLISCCLLTFLQAVAQEDLLQSQTIPQDLTKNADAVVRLNSMDIHLKDLDEMEYTVHKIITVLKESGDKDVDAYVGYDDSRKIKNIEANIYDALGNRIKRIKEKDFKDVSAVDGFSLYTDSRVKYLNYTPVTYPYTVDFTYEVHTKNTAYLPYFYFVEGYEVSSQKEEIKVTHDFPLEFLFEEKSFDGYNIKKQKLENGFVYTAENIPAIKYEELSPAAENYLPLLKTAPVDFTYEGYKGHVTTWEEAGKWMYNNLLVGRDKLSEATITKAKELTQGVTDPIEKAKIIYKYVQDNTRYISVQVGIGGMQPIPADEVDNVKYGDCKGLSNYTHALLEAVGVPSYYTHVEAGDDKISFDEAYPSIFGGNHIILAIPDAENNLHWVDCTSQTIPFGFIGDFTDDRNVLMMTPEGGKFVRTTSYLNQQNKEGIAGEVTLEDNGNIKANFSITSTGIQYDNRYGLEQLSKEKLDKYDKRFWGSLSNLKIEKHEFINDKNNVVFKENLNLSATNYGSKSGDRIIFTPNAINSSSYVPTRYRSRFTPFEIERGYLDEDSLTIHLPEGYKIESLPTAVKIASEFGEYQLQVKTLDEHTILCKKHLLIKAGRYAKDKYDDYREFRKKIALAEGAKASIITTTNQ